MELNNDLVLTSDLLLIMLVPESIASVERTQMKTRAGEKSNWRVDIAYHI